MDRCLKQELENEKVSSLFYSKCCFYFHVDVFDGAEGFAYLDSSYTEGEIECSKTMVTNEKSKEVGSIRSCIYFVKIIDYILRSNFQRCDG